MTQPLSIDLHSHSTHSDGIFTPTELLRQAAAAGLQVFALTDHDTVAGAEEAASCARTLGMRFVPGVEISASWHCQPVHVLGLWIDPDDAKLRARLAGQIELRRARMRKICQRLNALRLPGDALLAAVESRGEVATRAHLAAALTAAGHVKDAEEAFRKYLGAGKPANVATDWPPLIDAIEWIVAAGGAAVLAHPMRYPLSAGARRTLMSEFARGGGRALEVIAGGGMRGGARSGMRSEVHSGGQYADAYTAWCERFGLQGSVGSDFHRPLAWNPLGRLAKLPDRIVPVWRSFGI